MQNYKPHKINRSSSPEEKKDISDVVYDSLVDAFFERVTFINLAYSDFGSGGTTSTTNYDKDSRLIDSSGGRLMAPGKESRMRCQFYLKNPSKLDGYLLSPAVYDSYNTGGITTSLEPLRAYVGLRFLSGSVYAVTKEAGGAERLYPLDITWTMYDATYTDTYTFETVHNVGSTDIYINGTLYKTLSSDLIGSFRDNYVFYPLFAPGRSTDGTSVNIVAENIQFIQNK